MIYCGPSEHGAVFGGVQNEGRGGGGLRLSEPGSEDSEPGYGRG